MFNVVVTDFARNDILKAALYISESLSNKTASLNLLDEIEKKLDLLTHSPLAHKIVDEPVLAKCGIRMLMVKNYLLFYTADETLKKVTVIRFLHSRQDWIAVLTDV